MGLGIVGLEWPPLFKPFDGAVSSAIVDIGAVLDGFEQARAIGEEHIQHGRSGARTRQSH